MFDFNKLKQQAGDFFDTYGEFESLNVADYNNDKTLVIVVDMVKGFCTLGALSSENCGGIAKNIAQFLNTVPKSNLAFVRDCHVKDSTEFLSFPPHCISGEVESELVDELKDFVGIDVEKNSTNAFFSLTKKVPDLLSKYESFVLLGVCTDICVLQLALSLKTAINERNLKNEVTVVAPLTQTFDLGKGHPSDFMNAVALKLMQASGIVVKLN